MTSQSPFLSIIVPFHDSAGKCDRLLATLGAATVGHDAEIILVDDGSTDSTRELIEEFAGHCRLSVQIVHQPHAGPGAARNAGLSRARGEYVWFVDSDDDIDLGAIADAKAHSVGRPDVILWEWDHPAIRRAMPPGPGDRGRHAPLPDQFDPIVANCYSRHFLDRAAIRFPEYCVVEATPIEAFVLPLLVDRWVKSEFVAYQADTDCPSVTRTGGRIDPQYFDRLATVRLGMTYASAQPLSPEMRGSIERGFIRLFLWYSIALSRRPGPSWIRALRIMRQYRDEARRFGIGRDPLELFEGRSGTRAVIRMLWSLSAMLPSQKGFFERMRQMAWGRPILWVPPVSAEAFNRLPTGADGESFPAAPADP